MRFHTKPIFTFLVMMILVSLGHLSPVSGVPVSVAQNGCNFDDVAFCMDLEGVRTGTVNIEEIIHFYGLDISNETPEGLVMSVTSYVAENLIVGGVRIRSWSRQESLKNLLDTSSDRQFAVEINDVTSTIASVGPRAPSFNVDFARPEEDDGNDGLLDEVIYDIISFFGIPTETISAIVNNITVDEVRVSDDIGNTTDASVIISRPSPDVLDLPERIAGTTTVDREVAESLTNASGLQVRFAYSLSGASGDRFPVRASSEIGYAIFVLGEVGPRFFSIAEASVLYPFTGEFSKTYLPIVIR